MDTNDGIRLSSVHVKGIGSVRHWARLCAALVGCLLACHSPFIVMSGWGYGLNVVDYTVLEDHYLLFGAMGWGRPDLGSRTYADVNEIVCSGFPAGFQCQYSSPYNIPGGLQLWFTCGGAPPCGTAGVYGISCQMDVTVHEYSDDTWSVYSDVVSGGGTITVLPWCTPPFCGDGKCDPPNETCSSCPVDCGQCNSPPSFSAPAATSYQILAGKQITITIQAYDPNGDSLAISLGPHPPGATFTGGSGTGSATGVFTWTPLVFGEDDYQQHASFTARDIHGAVAYLELDFNVFNLDLNISQVLPIQVVFEPHIDSGPSIDLVQNKKTAVLVSFEIDSFDRLGIDDQVHLTLKVNGTPKGNKVIRKADLHADDLVYKFEVVGKRAIIKWADLYFIPYDNGNFLLEVGGELKRAGGATLIEESRADNNVQRRSITVWNTGTKGYLDIAYGAIVDCEREAPCYGPRVGQETADEFKARVTRTIFQGHRFVEATFPVSQSPTGPLTASNMTFFNGSEERCIITPPWEWLYDCPGIESDTFRVWMAGLALDPDATIAIVPKDYFIYHGDTLNTLLGLYLPGIRAPLVVRDAIPVVAHELGHACGLWLGEFEEYDTAQDPPRGFWVEYTQDRGRWMSPTIMDVHCFMDYGEVCPFPPSPSTGCDARKVDQRSFWIHDFDYVKLFQTAHLWIHSSGSADLYQASAASLNASVLHMGLVFHREGGVDLFRFYWGPEGKVSQSREGGNGLIEIYDYFGSMIGEFNFDVNFSVYVDPGGVFPTKRAPVGLTLPFPEGTSSIAIKVGGETCATVNVTQKLLDDAIDSIPDYGFANNPSQLRNALHNKVSALEYQISAGDFVGARQKLVHDIRKHIQEWLVEDYVVTDPLQLTKTKILELVDELTNRLSSP